MVGIDLIRFVRKGDYVTCDNGVTGKVAAINRKNRTVDIDHNKMIQTVPIGNIERIVDKKDLTIPA